MKTVLLIEDDRVNRKLLRDILEIKFTVVDVNSAELALSLLNERIPHAIFLDMQLPGMDGTDFLKRLKKNTQTATIPVIGVSARAFPDDVEDGMKNGCLEYVTKPIAEDPFCFMDRMEALIEGHMKTTNFKLAPRDPAQNQKSVC